METGQNSQIKFTNKIKTPFTWVENDLIRSKSLSAEEIGLYVILRSFGDNIYPSVDYLANLAKMGRKKVYAVLKQLINAKLLIRKQTKKGKVFSNTEYRILSFTDDYEEIYKEFIGEEPLNPQTLDNSQSRLCGHLRHTQIRHALNDTLIRIIDKKELLKEKKHTRSNSNLHISPKSRQNTKGVCENSESKKENKTHTPLSPLVAEIKKLDLFKNEDEKVINNLAKQYPDCLTAAKYLNYQNKKGLVEAKKPLAYLITTLKNMLYDDVDELEKKEREKHKIESASIEQKIKDNAQDDLIDQQVTEYLKTLPEQKYLEEINKIKLKYYKNLSAEIQEGMAVLKFKAILRQKIRAG